MKFIEFKKAVQGQLDHMIKDQDKLFITSIEKDTLWEKYLSSYPKGTNEIYKERPQFECNNCKSFIRNYGNLVTIKDNELISIWDIEDLEYPFNVVAKELSQLVKSAPIENVFITKESDLGVDKNLQQLEDGHVCTWEHFYYKLPIAYVDRTSKTKESIQGYWRDTKNVFKRAMEELTLDAGQTVLDLITQNSLYKGLENKKSIELFISYKLKYDSLKEEEKNNWCWSNSFDNRISRIKNSSIGTLLVDISENEDLEVAVKKFEDKVAPENYKRPKTIYTQKMVDAAQKTIVELGYENSLGRRHATLEDITVNNTLFVNRDARKKLNSTSIFDELKEDIPEKLKKFDRVEEVRIEDFIKNILPTSTCVSLMMENRHQNNLVSLVAPKDKDAPNMFKHGNNFSHDYYGNVADSMKQNVKNAGGNVDGVLRFSIQWNDGDNNQNDFDAHCIEPCGNHIYYSNKKNSRTLGNLDVDITRPSEQMPNGPAVENITWPNIDKMGEGIYDFFVHNFSYNGGRTGFTAELEYDGQIYSYEYPYELRYKENVKVVKVRFTKAKGLEFLESLESSTTSKEIWGLKTNKFAKVSICMLSPNYWDEKEVGNKHYFFFLDGCKNEQAPRGFYNEFLKNDLMEHRKVFEALGAKMRVEPSDNQLSGLGFSSTKRNSIIARVEGSFTRDIKLIF